MKIENKTKGVFSHTKNNCNKAKLALWIHFCWRKCAWNNMVWNCRPTMSRRQLKRPNQNLTGNFTFLVFLCPAPCRVVRPPFILSLLNKLLFWFLHLIRWNYHFEPCSHCVISNREWEKKDWVSKRNLCGPRVSCTYFFIG